MPSPLFNPFAGGFTDDPYPHYSALRKAAPVYHHAFGFWVLTRYADVSSALRGQFSVENKSLGGNPLRRSREVAHGAQAPINGMSMLGRDPPDHTRLRRLVSKAFTPRAIELLRPRIAALVDGMLDEVARAGRVDLVEALAFPLPFTVIAEMLGTPTAEHERIRKLTGTVVRSFEPVANPEIAAEIAAAEAEMAGIASEFVAWKRANPADDLLTAMINAEDGGNVLSDEELVAQTLLLYIGGHETTVNLISGGMLALLRHPDQLALLAEDPARVPGAVEELLRYDSPVQVSRRITMQPATFGGVEIPSGEFVLALLGSANRDEEFWGPDAGALKLSRENARQHVSFGAGLHHCLGASLARLEACIVFERITARLPGLALDGDVTWNGRINLRGPARLPVRTG